MPPTLRDYQQRDLERLRAEYRGGARAVLYQAPTGSGKTVLFAHVVRGAQARGSRVWIVVHRQELLDQTSRTLTSLGLVHGIVSGPRTDGATHPVIVATVQTLARRVRAGKLAPPDLIVVDEAHHAVAGTWRQVLTACRDARVLGVTATPERLDGRGLGIEASGTFDTLVVGPTVTELTAAGWLAPYRLYVPPRVADLAGVTVRAGDYAPGEAAAAMDRPTVTGDAVAHYRRALAGAPAIAFCTRITHAERVAEAFRADGWSAASIDGTLSDADRRQRIADLGEGRLHVLTSCEIVSEGTDVPVVTGAILLRPTQSLGLYLQQVGRVLRPAPGKEAAVILDHVGNSERHGLPDEEREWSLEGREAAGATRATAVTTCPACFAAYRPGRPACPYCGHVRPPAEPEIEEEAGDLVEVDETGREQMRAQRRQEVGRARDRESLERIARERGYKPGWVEHVMRGRGQGSQRRASA